MATGCESDKRTIPFQISPFPGNCSSETVKGSYYLVPKGYRVLLVQREESTRAKNTSHHIRAYLPATKSTLPDPGINSVPSNHKKYMFGLESGEYSQDPSLWHTAYSNYRSLKMDELSKCNIFGEPASRLIANLWQQMTDEERLRFQY
ncbi:hypothetical protein K493DRAFT_296329 [Basidiobolus meristosporus CBS 931.73]|uniref:Uncharacterized protein n=1 Tax=Basidiobolus meristosporus CBS 931.73 TaxID=1314790 RepID=A0A1Y1Z684_9FUNG|nr:hypothetical protein K493DRAFT_296329 [Basidiobolus meristosporus CBS 931.73]|eukprot:ORY05769.1 hypothetical protein K493DRAFT_296329 [Basidiobolus meristosporus CBS 931.73]